MAAKGAVNSHSTETETIVNRWVVDYYMYLAVESYQRGENETFCGIREAIDHLLNFPLEVSDAVSTKLRILQFLSRIHEGENLDISFESDQSVTPLESALMLLDDLREECSVSQQDFENVSASLKEMIVGIFIKNSRFNKAKEMLNQHFPKSMVGKKAVFMSLISNKSETHEVLKQMNFHRFKQEMLVFCQRYCPFTVPFLHKTAKQLIERRAEQSDKAAGPDVRQEPSPSSGLQINTLLLVPCNTIIQRARLEAAYKAMTAGLECERTFAQLEEEVEREEWAVEKNLSLCLSPSPKRSTSEDSEQDEPFQRHSGSPMEASPADQLPQTDAGPQMRASSPSKTPPAQGNGRLHPLARLVVEPDSQLGSQYSTASQEPEAEVGTERSPRSPTPSNKTDLQSPLTDNEITKPSRKHPRRAAKRCTRATACQEMLTDSEEDLPCSMASRKTCARKLHNPANNWLSGSSSPAPCKTPERETDGRPRSDSLNNDSGDADEVCIVDSALDTSPNLFPHEPVPQTSSTPHKDSTQDKNSSKWKQLYQNAVESKERWTDEESFFASRRNCGSNARTNSNSSNRKRMWTEGETQKLREGVRRFGEGNWNKIRSYFEFRDRSNVNLKDRWRTMKKLNMT